MNSMPMLLAIDTNTMQSVLSLGIILACLCSAAAFVHDRSSIPISGGNVRPEPNFHVVAQKIGKTVLRPGGSKATEDVQTLANVRPGDTVLELSSGLGRSGIELARKYGAKVMLTDIVASRLEEAENLAKKLGLSHLVSVQQLDMFKMEGQLGSDAKFDVAQVEASLTHYSHSKKAKFFDDVSRHADKLILHEVCFKTDDVALQELTKKDMSKVVKVSFVPETSESWQKLLRNSGYSIDHVATGDIAVLNPLNVLQDEGLMGFLNILFNVATQPYLRSRMLAMRRAILKHKGELGFITIVASKK